MARVFLVDDHEVVIAGYRRLFESTSDIVVAGAASSGEDAIEQHECKPKHHEDLLGRLRVVQNTSGTDRKDADIKQANEYIEARRKAQDGAS